MTQEQVKVHISLRDGVLELQGSEGFVSDQLKFLEPLIKESFKAVPRNPGSELRDPPPPPPRGTEVTDQPDGLAAYDTVFADADGKVQILKTLPGKTKSAKSINAALLLAFANSLKGNESTPYSDVRDLCSSHACLDSGNFSATMKSQKEHFIVSGNGSSQSIKLTVPGKKKAQSIAEGLK